MTRWYVPALALSILSASASMPLAGMEEAGTLSNRAMAEISGIVRSDAHEGVYWVHNDGGNEPRLFAIDGNGRTIAPESWLAEEGGRREGSSDRWEGIRVWSASNVDWEDIALDGGRIFLADMGNNANARKNLGVYILEEPDPRVVRAVRPLLFLPVAYPDQKSWPAEQWHFDCEAVFIDRGHLYFITKHRRPGRMMSFEAGANLYRLDTYHTDRTNILVRVGSHPAIELATAADLSPSGDRLAVLTYGDLWIFDRPSEGDDWLSGHSVRIPLDRRKARQNEAVTWIDERSLLMANENRDLFRITLDAGTASAAPAEDR